MRGCHVVLSLGVVTWGCHVVLSRSVVTWGCYYLKLKVHVTFPHVTLQELLKANAIPALVNILKPEARALPEDENSVKRLELKMQTSAVIKNISRSVRYKTEFSSSAKLS